MQACMVDRSSCNPAAWPFAPPARRVPPHVKERIQWDVQGTTASAPAGKQEAPRHSRGGRLLALALAQPRCWLRIASRSVLGLAVLPAVPVPLRARPGPSRVTTRRRSASNSQVHSCRDRGEKGWCERVDG